MLQFVFLQVSPQVTPLRLAVCRVHAAHRLFTEIASALPVTHRVGHRIPHSLLTAGCTRGTGLMPAPNAVSCRDHPQGCVRAATILHKLPVAPWGGAEAATPGPRTGMTNWPQRHTWPHLGTVKLPVTLLLVGASRNGEYVFSVCLEDQPYLGAQRLGR